MAFVKVSSLQVHNKTPEHRNNKPTCEVVVEQAPPSPSVAAGNSSSSQDGGCDGGGVEENAEDGKSSKPEKSYEHVCTTCSVKFEKEFSLRVHQLGVDHINGLFMHIYTLI